MKVFQKKVVLIFILFSLLNCKKATNSVNSDPSSDTKDSADYFVDKRDNERYQIIQIGNQTWMAENLRYKGNELKYGDDLDSIPESNASLFYFNYKNSEEDHKKYGLLYTMAAAQIACPEGWHLPSDQEWMIMEKYLGMSENQAKSFGWRGTNEGFKIKEKGNSGFQALMSGYRSSLGKYFAKGEVTVFWTSSEATKNVANHRALYRSESQIQRDNAKISDGFCVRCVKD